jgi:DNA-binding MarR family transcriptional regulator
MTADLTAALIAFMNARLIEDDDDIGEFDWAITYRNPAAARTRAIRETEADRALLARYENLQHPQGLRERIIFPALAEMILACIRDRAAVHRDHPDYRREWAP